MHTFLLTGRLRQGIEIRVCHRSARFSGRKSTGFPGSQRCTLGWTWSRRAAAGNIKGQNRNFQATPGSNHSW